MFDDKLRFNLKFLDFAPIVHISALTGERTPKLLEVVDKVMEERTRRIPTPELNRFLQEVTAAHPMPSPGKKAVRILYAAQVGVAPPTFALFTNVHDRAALFIRAVSEKPPPREVRIFGHADPTAGAEEKRRRRGRRAKSYPWILL